MNRRNFLGLMAGSLAAGSVIKTSLANAVSSTPVKAIAFDAFPIFDPRPIFKLTTALFPEKGEELGKLWRTRQFEYTWLRTAGNRYKDFWQVTEDALIFAASTLKLELTSSSRKQLMDAYLQILAWPDVKPALEKLRNSNIRLAFLSNFTPRMLTAGIKNSALDGLFDHILSTDLAKTYKPDSRAYQLGIDAFKLPKQEILFTAFAGWDAVGAKWFGYPTFWMNRLNFLGEELNASADVVGHDMDDLVRFFKN